MSNVQGSNVQGSNVQGSNVRGSNVQGSNVQGSNVMYLKVNCCYIYNAVCGLPFEPRLLKPPFFDIYTPSKVGVQVG